MKNLWLGTMGVLALCLVGCNPPAPKITTELEPQAECTFKDSKVTAPNWVCSAPLDGIAVSAVGSHEKSAAGEAFMKTMAAAQARAELATSFKVYVQAMVKTYVGTTGVGTSETVDAVYSATGKQITNETLAGSKIYRTTFGPTGTMYVLVGMDDALAQKAAKDVIATSFKNDNALYQQFLSKMSQDELAAEIAKTKM